MKLMERLGGWRQILLRCMGWLHCGLIIALFYAAVLRVAQGEEVLPGAMWRGLLVVIPLAVVDLGGEFCRKLWQFTLVSLVACGLTWLLLGYLVAAVPVAVVCFFRGKNRLSEEPVESMLDRPHLPLVLVAVLPFLYSALGGGAKLQKLCLIWAVVYLLLDGARNGFGNIQEYLSLNRNMAGVPVKRIVRTSGLAVLGMLVLAGGLLLPALISDDSYFRIESQEKQAMAPVEMDSMEMGMPSLPPELQEMGDNASFHIPPFVSYFFMAVMGAAVVLCLLYGAYLILRNFRTTFVDHRDVVQYLRGPEDKEDTVPKAMRKRPSIWDRSPNAQVRRKYRREVLRVAKEQPARWAAPQEIEEEVGLQDVQLHLLYEKARYSREGCTLQESRQLKR